MADNYLDGLKVLAAQHDTSYQVFLWRADIYLMQQFRDVAFDKIMATLEKGGAAKINEWDPNGTGGPHFARLSIPFSAIKSSVVQKSYCIVELCYYKNPTDTTVSLIVHLDFGQDFRTVARSRDFPRGTVLDRVFGLDDLDKLAVETPKLESIEVSFGEIGYPSTPDVGYGFYLNVALSNPFPRGPKKDQSVDYMACSDLEPLGPMFDDVKPKVHVARDVLVSTGLTELHERGYLDTFMSAGGEWTPREHPKTTGT